MGLRDTTMLEEHLDDVSWYLQNKNSRQDARTRATLAALETAEAKKMRKLETELGVMRPVYKSERQRRVEAEQRISSLEGSMQLLLQQAEGQELQVLRPVYESERQRRIEAEARVESLERSMQ